MLLHKIKMALFRYVFLGSSGSVVLKLMKRFKMDNGLLKDLVYAGLVELLHNKKYYYYSTIGLDYSHLTDEGKTAIVDLLHMVAPHIIKAREQELDERAKKMVMDGLKS